MKRFDDVCGENVDNTIEATLVGFWQVFVPKMAADGGYSGSGTVLER